MPNRLRCHLTYANVTATLAIFVALGGSSFAAVKLTGRDIRDNSLTGRDVRSLTSKDIRNGSLLAADLRAGQLPRAEPGPRGPAGTPGKSGPPGPANVVVRYGPETHGDCFEDCEGTYDMSDSLECEPGERATGGGVKGNGGTVIDSYPTHEPLPQPWTGPGPSAKPTAWVGTTRYTATQSPAAIPSPEVYVICVASP